MTVELNTKALEKTRTRVVQGDVVHDTRDDVSEHAPKKLPADIDDGD